MGNLMKKMGPTGEAIATGGISAGRKREADLLASAGILSKAQRDRFRDPLNIEGRRSDTTVAPTQTDVPVMPLPATDLQNQITAQKKAAGAARLRSGRLSTILSQNDTGTLG